MSGLLSLVRGFAFVRALFSALHVLLRFVLTKRAGVSRFWQGVGRCLCCLVAGLTMVASAPPFVLAESGVAQLPTHLWQPGITSLALDRHFLYWVDAGADTTLPELLAQPPPWTDSMSAPWRDFYRREPVWMRFDVQAKELQANKVPAMDMEASHYVLEIQSTMLDRVDFFQVEQVAGGVPLVIHQETGGDHFPATSNTHASRYVTFLVTLRADTDTTLYLRIHSASTTVAAIRLWEKQALDAHELLLARYYGAFFGIMTVMAIYNLVLWLFIRENAYLYYVCYVVAAMFFQAAMCGDGYRYLWGDSLWWRDHAMVVGVALCFIFAIAFVVRFLRLQEIDPKAYRYAVAGLACYVALIWLSPWVTEATLSMLAQPLGLLLCALVVWVSIRQWRDGSNQVATFFMIGWTLLVLGTAVYTLMMAGFLPHNLVTRHVQEIGMLAEVVLLSFALAARINEEKHARRLALETSLNLAQQVNTIYQEQLATQENMNRELEHRVVERTAALQQALADLNEANARLEQLSLTDGLTGLNNRRYLDQHLPIWMESANKQRVPLAALVIDVDHFKRINDTYGHLLGDQCLKAVAASIRATVHRPDDLVVRYGGEEFVVVLRNTDATGALQVAERARLAIEKAHWEWEGTHIPVTVSIGVAMMHSGIDRDPATLLARADTALYAAKHAGRNRVMTGEHWPQNATDQPVDVSSQVR